MFMLQTCQIWNPSMENFPIHQWLERTLSLNHFTISIFICIYNEWAFNYIASIIVCYRETNLKWIFPHFAHIMRHRYDNAYYGTILDWVGSICAQHILYSFPISWVLKSNGKIHIKWNDVQKCLLPYLIHVHRSDKYKMKNKLKIAAAK